MKYKYIRILDKSISIIKNSFNIVILTLSISCVFLFIWFFKPKIPNLLGIKNFSSVNTLFEVIPSALASILGIIIAVILVAFEILRKTYTTYAFKIFFKNKHLKELFTLYILTIIVSVITITSLSDPLDSRDISLIYFSIFLFITSILILFPYSRKIITSTQSKERIKELVNQIDYSVIKSFGYFRPHISSINISSIENNPIFILSEVGIRTLKDDDRLTPKFILIESANKLLNILDSSKDKRMTINAFLIIFRNIARQAIKSHQEGTLQTILNNIKKIHSFCAEKHILWHDVIELNETLSSILRDSIKAGLYETVKVGFYIIKDIMKKHLDKNIPKEDEIWNLHIRTGKEIPIDHNKSIQWRHISNDYIGMISNIIEESIELKREHVAIIGLYSLINIALEVMDSKLGDLQKTDIIRWSYYYANILTLKCVDGGLYKEGIAISPFFPLGIEHALKKKTEYSREPLIQFSNLLFKLAQKNLLDKFILNELGTVGRGVAHKLDEDNIYKEALIFITNVFNKLREIVEEDLSAEKKNIYIEIYSQTESLKNWMKQYDKRDSDVENKLNDVLSRFNKLEVLRKEQTESIVKWPKIF